LLGPVLRLAADGADNDIRLTLVETIGGQRVKIIITVFQYVSCDQEAGDRLGVSPEAEGAGGRRQYR